MKKVCSRILQNLWGGWNKSSTTELVSTWPMHLDGKPDLSNPLRTGVWLLHQSSCVKKRQIAAVCKSWLSFGRTSPLFDADWTIRPMICLFAGESLCHHGNSIKIPSEMEQIEDFPPDICSWQWLHHSLIGVHHRGHRSAPRWIALLRALPRDFAPRWRPLFYRWS